MNSILIAVVAIIALFASPTVLLVLAVVTAALIDLLAIAVRSVTKALRRAEESAPQKRPEPVYPAISCHNCGECSICIGNEHYCCYRDMIEDPKRDRSDCQHYIPREISRTTVLDVTGDIPVVYDVIEQAEI